jgi:sporulation protein YlmC with PRC-barrel domain
MIQNTPINQSGTINPTASNFRRVLSASSLSGDKVVNTAGEDLGKLDDIMIDLPTGRIAYAVLSFGGFLGIGNKLFAIPWSRLSVDEVNRRMILDVDRDLLERAPGFDKDNWPDMSDPSFGSQIYSYYGAEPFWENTDTPPAGSTTVRPSRPKATY